MTQNFDVFAKRKGQSAIEYLMTYGWMLLVVAIVGGAIFATVQGQCTQSTSGFAASDVRVMEYAVGSDGEIALDIQNGASETVTVQDIEVGADSDTGIDQNIEVGSSSAISVTDSDFTSSDGCNTFDVTINYTTDTFTDTQVVTGTLTGSYSQ